MAHDVTRSESDNDWEPEEAPLTELNVERCRSEGVGSMWVGSLRT